MIAKNDCKALNYCKILPNDLTYLKAAKVKKPSFHVFTLANIQELLTDGIMGEETGSRSKFNSVPFYEICLKITTYSINEIFLSRVREEYPNFKVT